MTLWQWLGRSGRTYGVAVLLNLAALNAVPRLERRHPVVQVRTVGRVGPFLATEVLAKAGTAPAVLSLPLDATVSARSTSPN